MIAAQKAISCPLLEAGGVRGARGILINITGSSSLGLHEVNEACTLIRAAAENEDVQINFGVVLNEAAGRRGQDHRDRHRLRAGNAAHHPSPAFRWRGTDGPGRGRRRSLRAARAAASLPRSRPATVRSDPGSRADNYAARSARTGGAGA